MDAGRSVDGVAGARRPIDQMSGALLLHHGTLGCHSWLGGSRFDSAALAWARARQNLREK